MQTAAPSLALQALLKSAARRTGLYDAASGFSGLTPPARALYAAAVSAGHPLVVVVATDRDVEQLVADARFFVSAIDGVSAADAERLVLPFPSQEVDPYRGLLPHLDVASARARALLAMAHGRARVVVASAAALMPRLSGREPSHGAIGLHFWLSVVGLAVYVGALSIGGTLRGSIYPGRVARILTNRASDLNRASSGSRSSSAAG